MGLLGALVLAILVALLFSPYKRRDSIMPLVIFFLVLFFSGLAAQFWVVPFGPVIWGVYWLPVIFIVLMFALLLSAPPAHRRPAPAKENSVTDPAVTAMSVFIWILLLVLAVAVIVGFYNSDTFIANPKN